MDSGYSKLPRMNVVPVSQGPVKGELPSFKKRTEEKRGSAERIRRFPRTSRKRSGRRMVRAVPVRARNGAQRPGTIQMIYPGSSILLKMGICAVVLASVLIFKSIETPATQSIVDGLRSALTYDVAIDRKLGQLEFVQNYLPGVAAVFNGGSSWVLPAEGTATKVMEDGVANAMAIATTPGAMVRSAAKGTVKSIGNGRIVVDHGGVELAYEGMATAAVRVGDSVDLGQRLGGLGEEQSVLTLRATKDGEAMDTLSLFQQEVTS